MVEEAEPKVELSPVAEILLKGFSWQGGNKEIDIDGVMDELNAFSMDEQAAGLDELMSKGMVAHDVTHH